MKWPVLFFLFLSATGHILDSEKKSFNSLNTLFAKITKMKRKITGIM